MKKLLNHPKNIVSQMTEGYLRAFGGMYERIPGRNCLVLREKREKVSIVTGGGSGGEPWAIGMAGIGMADGTAVGNVFAAPSALAVLEVCKAVYHEQGVLLITGNHSGDVLNFELVGELALIDHGIRCSTMFVTDDISTSPKDKKAERRGIAGICMVIEIAAAAASDGLSLEEVTRVAQKANENLSTLAVTLAAGTMPVTGDPMGYVAENEVHFGMGFNGEPGFRVEQMCSADEIVDILMENLSDDLNLQVGDEVSVLINGLGSTGLMEQLIVCRRALEYLEEKGVAVFDTDISEKFRVQETSGLSISLMKMDDELKRYYAKPAYSPICSRQHINPAT